MPDIRGARRIGLLLLPLIAALAVVPATRATASPLPSSVTCSGKTAAVKGEKTKVGYAFHCSQEIKSYTIVSTASIGGFDVNVNVFTSTGALDQTTAWGCEGDIPGDGFNCNGSAPARETTSGQFEPEQLPCTTKNRWRSRTWVVIGDSQMNSATPPAAETQTAGPFLLNGPKKCQGPKPKKTSKKRHH